MITWAHHLLTIAVAVSLFICLVFSHGMTATFHLRMYLLDRAALTEVVWSARLATAVSLTLYNLTAEVRSYVLLLLYWLIEMHLCLNMVTIGNVLMMKPCHLNILHLRLVYTRAFPWEEFLLILWNFLSLLHLVGLGCWALRFCKLFCATIGLNLSIIIHIALVLLLNLNITMSGGIFLASWISFNQLMLLYM